MKTNCIICRLEPRKKNSDQCKSCFDIIKKYQKELKKRYNYYTKDLNWNIL